MGPLSQCFFLFVVFSVWELIAQSDGRLSVLRAFRLLRFVRLLHFLPYLLRQLLVLKRTIAEAGPLCMLLLFFTFVCRHVHTKIQPPSLSFVRDICSIAENPILYVLLLQ